MIQPISYLGLIFYDLMRNQPPGTFFSTSLWLATSIVELDKLKKEEENANTSQNDKFLAELREIKNNTHKDLKKYLAEVETIVAAYPRERWNDEYEGMDNKENPIRINDRNVRIIDLARLLKESYETMVRVVGFIIKDYSMEYRNVPSMGGSDVPVWMGGGQK